MFKTALITAHQSLKKKKKSCLYWKNEDMSSQVRRQSSIKDENTVKDIYQVLAL